MLHGLQLWIALTRGRTAPVPLKPVTGAGAGWLATGTSGAGLAKTSCCAVSSPASAAASVMACGDRG